MQKILDAGEGGILASWRRVGVDLNDTLQWARLSRAASGAVVTSASALDRVNPNSIVQDPVSGRLFATKFVADPVTRLYRQSIIRLLPVTLEIDSFWSPPTADADVAAITETHLYLTNNRRMLRSANSATNDLVWTIADRNRPTLAGWIDTAKAGDALMWPTRGAPQAIRSPTQAIGQRTAIEYFAKHIQRFFITTRAAEQQQLDALPAQFARTGMQFGTFDGEVTPPSATIVEAALPPPPFSAAGALPICRFYSPPERGGSNTHFYGDGTDCQFLNTVSGVVNEGYDFAAPMPAALTGLCPANAATPVYRMFNNQSASNNSNHRYVVSLARIDEMKARGWVAEGIAFCATSATDSKGFGRW